MSFADKVVEGGERTEWLFREYVKRVFRLSAWYRFATGKTDVSALRKVLGMKIRQKTLSLLGRRRLPPNIEKLCSEGRLNRLFFESFDAVIRNRLPILFVLAANDPGTEVFRCYFENGYLRSGGKGIGDDTQVRIVEIENANHVYALTECRESLIRNIRDFLRSQLL
jgi:hypothetical protein